MSTVKHTKTIILETTRHHNFEDRLCDAEAEHAAAPPNKRGSGLQARATKYLLPGLFPINFPEDFARRIRGWVKLPLWGLEVQIQGHLQFLSQFSKAVINSVLKTWLNGWPDALSGEIVCVCVCAVSLPPTDSCTLLLVRP